MIVATNEHLNRVLYNVRNKLSFIFIKLLKRNAVHEQKTLDNNCPYYLLEPLIAKRIPWLALRDPRCLWKWLASVQCNQPSNSGVLINLLGMDIGQERYIYSYDQKKPKIKCRSSGFFLNLRFITCCAFICIKSR